MTTHNHHHTQACLCGHGHCGHNHEHHHDNHEHHHGTHEHHHGEMTLRRRLAWILSAVALLVLAVVADHIVELPMWQRLLLYLPSYLLIGYPTLREAAEGLLGGNPFNEHFLMSIATLGALTIGFVPGGSEAFVEAVSVMVLFQVGEWAESYAEGQSKRSISHLMDMRPDIAHLMDNTKGNQEQTVDISPEEVNVGQTIVVRPGEKFPLDGTIVRGSSTVNAMAITGESRPVSIGEGSEVFSGCLNLSGVVSVEVTKPFAESTATKIIELVEHAAERKAQSETFISRFARTYTPVVVMLAVGVAVVPPLLSGDFGQHFATWLYRALMFLVVSCPCALVISVPLTFFAGLGGASREGILIKGANFFDMLSNVDTVVFDKTGTLTRGQFSVEAVHDNDFISRGDDQTTVLSTTLGTSSSHLLHMAAHVEHHSTHPIAEALRKAFPEESSDGCTVSDIEERAGQGICALVDGRRVCIGNEKLMENIGATWHECSHDGTIVHVAIDGTYQGHIVVGDSVKPESRNAIAQLRSLGVKEIVMLTGDNEATARRVAKQLCMDDYHSELMPEEKLNEVEKLLISADNGKRVAFVGDGINDAPVLRRADVGIAMGGMGSDAAIEAADVVVMDDDPAKVATAILRARRTQQIAWQNVVFAVGVKVGFLLLAVFGLCTMWMAVFADVGVTVLAVLNAMRALGRKSH